MHKCSQSEGLGFEVCQSLFGQDRIFCTVNTCLYEPAGSHMLVTCGYFAASLPLDNSVSPARQSVTGSEDIAVSASVYEC